MFKTAQIKDKGFTLVELLVVIAIVAILAAVVALVINPVELTRRGRDATRLSDLASLQNAITVYTQENSPDTANWLLCDGVAPVPPPCRGDTDDVGAASSDGSGWVKIDLGNATQAVRLAKLPIDPSNITATSLLYYYGADGDNWEINTNLESTQYSGKEGTDGGDDAALYEVGSSLSVL